MAGAEKKAKDGSRIGGRLRKGESNNPGFGVIARQRRQTVWEIRERKIVYDEGWRVLMRGVSRDMDVPVQDVERILSAWWLYMWQWLGNGDMVSVKMTYLCTIKPSVKKLWGWLDRVGERIERVLRGETTRYSGVEIERLRVLADRVQEAWFRLEQEQARRKKVWAEVRARWFRGGERGERKVAYRRQLRVSLAEARALKKEIEKQKQNDNESGD